MWIVKYLKRMADKYGATPSSMLLDTALLTLCIIGALVVLLITIVLSVDFLFFR